MFQIVERPTTTRHRGRGPSEEGSAFLATAESGQAVRIEANGRKPFHIYVNLGKLAKRNNLRRRGQIRPDHVIVWAEKLA